ncbi:MAG: FAD-dependent oxidoreductase [Deltaproteobacteria bacterium]|nr:FAD-dependent oxidoreductase [Deltaproteobacteria bacterium]MBK8719235.1 FAD-dependent oxidoreductase [Deltaproteobacteria bacterium]MBP7287571.1 FAD-dependent oxidoreductase [Nannocystaceae bacterium]
MSSATEPAASTSGPDADVIIVGASFAGIEVLYQLQRRLADRPPRVLVIDRVREHGYIPLMQERLVDALPAARSLLHTAAWIDAQPRTRFVQGEVTDVDVDAHAVVLADGRRFEARVLVLAVGSELVPPPSLPGHERLLSHKSAAQFERLQAALGEALGAGEGTPELVVIGGGISGVELAAELAALRDRPARPWPRAPHVTLVGADARLVPNLEPVITARVAQVLASLGVDVRLGTRVAAVGEGRVTLHANDGESVLPCALAMWAGGIRPAPLLATLALPKTAQGWLAVSPTLQCFASRERDDPTIFACGDAVRIVGGEGEWPTMQRAIECLWQAKVVARNVAAVLSAESAEQVPPLHPHRFRPRFAYGVSLGPHSLVLWGRWCVDLPRINRWFRRWLMRQYFARYELPPS